MARRSLATSVVVTFSLAELACTSTGGGETRNPPPQILEHEEYITHNPPDPSGPIPENIDDGGAADADGGVNDDGGSQVDNESSQVKIERRSDGTCVEIVSVSCPEGVMCNPPPPREVPCPAEASENGGGDNPEEDSSKTVLLRADGTCWEHDNDFKCPPPGQGTCNPPRPRQVDCPPDKQLPEAKDPQRVTKRDNGECWESFGGSCPPKARCNPPPPRRVKCPTEPGKAE